MGLGPPAPAPGAQKPVVGLGLHVGPIFGFGIGLVFLGLGAEGILCWPPDPTPEALAV